jgi:nucleoside-diphosphate-sugar epimerase
MMGQRVAVIGGSGFIGTRLVTRLLASGHEVRIVDLQSSPAHPERVTLCDVRDADGLIRACAGMEVIYNLAAEHRDDVRPVSLYDEVNVQGARNTCAAARAAGIERVVFTSSVAVYGFSEGSADESSPTRPFNDYGRTKLEAEEVFRSWQSESEGRSLVIVRPTVVFGEDNRGNVFNLLRQIARGPFLMVGDGRNRKSMAYVENVAAFLEFCLGLPKGQALFNYVDKPDYDMRSLVAEIRSALGKNPRLRLRLPQAAGYAAGGLADLVAAAIRRPLPYSRIRVKKFCSSTQFSSERALSSGFEPPVELSTALQRTVAHEFGPGRPGEDNSRMGDR